MTHEHRPNAEHDHGPEADDSLPNAWEVPVFDNPEEAFSPLMEEKGD